MKVFFLNDSFFPTSYELMSLCESAEACMKALLGFDLPPLDSSALEHTPQPAAISSIEKTIAYHSESTRYIVYSQITCFITSRQLDSRGTPPFQ